MLAAVALLLFFYADADAIPSNLKLDDQSTVEGAVRLSIRLLEAEEYKKLIETIVHPEELEKIAANEVGLDTVVEHFRGDKAQMLLKAMKGVDPQQIKYNDAKTTATVALPEELNGQDRLEFDKLQGKWYLRD